MLNIQWHMAAKSVVMVDANIGKWKRNVPDFVLVVTPAATVVRYDFIMFLL